MGETPMRLGNVTERSWKGLKRGWLIAWLDDLPRIGMQ